jgi:hypothetical protein
MFQLAAHLLEARGGVLMANPSLMRCFRPDHARSEYS